VKGKLVAARPYKQKGGVREKRSSTHLDAEKKKGENRKCRESPVQEEREGKRPGGEGRREDEVVGRSEGISTVVKKK